MKDPKLKPCPFCGEGHAIFVINIKRDADTDIMSAVLGWVECTMCDRRGPAELRYLTACFSVPLEEQAIGDLKRKLADEWNLRTDNATAEQ